MPHNMFSLKVSQDMGGLLGLVSVKAKKEVQHLQLFLSGEKIRRPTSLVADIYSMTLILIQCGLNSLERHLFPCSICLESKVRSIRYTSKLFMALERFAFSSNLTVCIPPEEYPRVLCERAEDEEDAGEHPGLDGGEALGLGRVGGHGVEDVDQDEEEGDQQGHPT